MLDPAHIIAIVGLVGIFAIIFCESGVFFGFILPGDSLLFSAGLLASQGLLPIVWLLIGCAVAAVLGDSTGYMIGKYMGRRLFERDAGFLFKKERLIDAEHFYQKHGKYTIIIARFIPVIRTFAPIVAGIAKMQYSTFISYNIWGGVFWTASLLSLGYYLGTVVPNIDHYILPIIFLIILVSVFPVFFKLFLQKSKK